MTEIIDLDIILKDILGIDLVRGLTIRHTYNNQWIIRNNSFCFDRELMDFVRSIFFSYCGLH